MIITILAVVSIFLILFFYGLKHYSENGGYIIASKRFAMRRYVFPQSDELCKKLAGLMIDICKETFNGELASYGFLHGDYKSLKKRIICFMYDRKNLHKGPVSVNAPFQCYHNGERIIHAGLMMVRPDYQGMGIQTLVSMHFILYIIFNASSIILTEIGASSSYISIQERFLYDYYPRLSKPDMTPKAWHLDVTRFMLKNLRKEFGCSEKATLNDKTLVVVGSNQKDGGGAYHLIATYNTRRSRSQAKEEYLQNRLSVTNGDQQFFVGRLERYMLFHLLFGLKREKVH